MRAAPFLPHCINNAAWAHPVICDALNALLRMGVRVPNSIAFDAL
jgi:hypothetical protein